MLKCFFSFLFIFSPDGWVFHFFLFDILGLKGSHISSGKRKPIRRSLGSGTILFQGVHFL